MDINSRLMVVMLYYMFTIVGLGLFHYVVLVFLQKAYRQNFHCLGVEMSIRTIN